MQWSGYPTQLNGSPPQGPSVNGLLDTRAMLSLRLADLSRSGRLPGKSQNLWLKDPYTNSFRMCPHSTKVPESK